MASVALLFVGAVLIINGLMMLGYVNPKAAAPLNFFVGAMQVITPTYLIFTAGGDTAAILSAGGLYLFGFTYLYVGLNLSLNLDGTGVGWYSAFVALCALFYAWLNFSYFQPRDPAFGAIWLYWAFLWAMFWVVLGIKREDWTRYTGGVAIVSGVINCAIPAFLLLTNVWSKHLVLTAIALGVVEVVSVFALYPLRATWQRMGAVPPSAPVPALGPEVPEGVLVSRGQVPREPAGQDAGQGVHRRP